MWASAYIGSNVYVKAICSLKTEDRLLALTFDDGPHGMNTPLVLDVLKRYSVRATFFVIGKNIESNIDIIRRIVDEGHTIGNHTYSHSFGLPFYSTGKVASELEKCNRLIGDVTGKECTLFRPPFGVTNPNIGRAVRKMRMRTIGWSIRSFDTVSSRNRKDVAAGVIRKLHPGGIILLHDRCEDAANLLEEIIIYGVDNGYRFVSVDEFMENKKV